MTSTAAPLVGGIEAGGTKFVCAVGSGPDDLRDEVRFPTTTPTETIQQAIAFFRQQQAQHGALAAIGVATFGPADPHRASPTFGYITTTPKPGWMHTDVAGTLTRALHLPIAFDLDVNGAALGEHLWGAAQDVDSFIYLTIGTGVGGGAMVRGELLHGLVHPEMGHIRLPRDPQRDPYTGHCPFHGDCLEGLTCGPALADRWGMPAEQLPADHPAWQLQAHYLALALQSFICVLSPQRIIMGGGVMDQPHLLPLIRQQVQASLNGYIQHPALTNGQAGIDRYIVAPGLGNRAGVLGALALAQRTVAATA